ncbi:ComF family protein [Bacillaceae bacterium SIJ1]|uniref:ComF family protein n=1 Tax=Litoribacterium kuwaitense TaxID=1398745 RepID=UPI0013EC1EFA|nr:ComF family protein [Litoribacterium kuwaitense]NGP44944.1 ComF family protein [Litoribacterium kuwaitense]
MNCLYCRLPIPKSSGWLDWYNSRPQWLCQECERQFEPIDGQYCFRCMKQSDVEVEICSDCEKWNGVVPHTLQRNYSLFRYNDFMKGFIAQWKYRGDYQLGEVLSPVFNNAFQHVFSRQFTVVIPVPVNNERKRRRKFNQAEQLALFTGARIWRGVDRISAEAQSKKTRHARMEAKIHFEVTEADVPTKAVIIDDLYTTGATVHALAAHLKQAGMREIASMTLIRV